MRSDWLLPTKAKRGYCRKTVRALTSYFAILFCLGSCISDTKRPIAETKIEVDSLNSGMDTVWSGGESTIEEEPQVELELKFPKMVSRYRNNQWISRDSFLLEKYAFELKKEFLKESYFNTSFSEPITISQMDSLYGDCRQFLESAQVHYAPDSSFKIFVIETLHCGAYCGHTWYYWFYKIEDGREELLRKGNTSEQTRFSFTNIESIEILPDNKYLIIQGEEWAYINYIIVREIIVLSLIKNSIVYHPIKYRGFKRLHFENVWDDKEALILRYDVNSQNIHFKYALGERDYWGRSDTFAEGRFKYINGQFLLEKEVFIIHDDYSPEVTRIIKTKYFKRIR